MAKHGNLLYSDEAVRFIEQIPDPVTKALVNMAFVHLVKKVHLEKRAFPRADLDMLFLVASLEDFFAEHDAIARTLDGEKVGARHEAAPRHSQIKVIRPYKWEGIWVFDDPAVGLDKEALIAGMPELIELATARAGIAEPEKGFLALFSKDPFPTAQVCLEWAREEAGGNVYRWPETGLEGWLCPALFRYFDSAPRRLYVEVRPASEERGKGV
jgi:hypothetical protein